MVDNVRSTIRKALTRLNAEKARIDQQIYALKTALSGLGRRPQGTGAWRRRRLSAAARKAIAKRMKAYWAKRRAKMKAK